MWLLKDSKGKVIYLKPNKTVTISRKQGDIILQNDESISRVHASIIVQPKEEVKVNEPTSLCIIKDTGSKYGSFILHGKEQKQITKEGYSLNPSDRIRFGLQQHIFTVLYIPIISVTSSLNDNDKSEVQSIINSIDGIIMPDWVNSCTHLTVSIATLTEKVACALASGIPIVDIKYWKALLRSVETNQELPSSTNFVLPINEGTINNDNVSLCPNNMRRTLFKNLVFVHFTVKQYNLFTKMIKISGGKSILHEKKPLNNKEICANNVIVLQISSTSSQCPSVPTASYDLIYEVLRKNKRRMIPEFEIPLAILYCSTKQYCNPKFDFAQLLNAPRQNKDESSPVLVLDTQDATNCNRQQRVKVVQETPELQKQNLETIASSSISSEESNDMMDLGDNSESKLKKEIRTTDTLDSCASVKSSKISDRRVYEKREVKLTSNVHSGSSQIISIDSKGLELQKQFILNAYPSKVEDDSRNVGKLHSNKSNKSGDKLSSTNSSEEKASSSWMSNTKEHIAIDSKTNDNSIESSVLTAKQPSRKRNALVASNKAQWISTESEIDISSDDESYIIAHNTECTVKRKGKHLKLSTSSRMDERTPERDRQLNSSVRSHVKIESDEEDDNLFASVSKMNKNKTKLADNSKWEFEEIQDVKSDSDNDIFNVKTEKITKKGKSPKRKKNLQCKSSVNVKSAAENELSQRDVELTTYDSDKEKATAFDCKINYLECDDYKYMVTSLLRSDIDIHRNNNVNFESFTKIFDLIPMRRLTPSDMYIWDSRNEMIKDEFGSTRALMEYT